VPFGIRLKGNLDVQALERSLGEIVRRHEVLRTRLAMVDGESVQVVEEWRRLSLLQHDLREMEAQEREQQAQQIAKEEWET